MSEYTKITVHIRPQTFYFFGCDASKVVLEKAIEINGYIHPDQINNYEGNFVQRAQKNLAMFAVGKFVKEFGGDIDNIMREISFTYTQEQVPAKVHPITFFRNAEVNTETV